MASAIAVYLPASLICQCHISVSPGQQAGAVGVDDGVAMETGDEGGGAQRRGHAIEEVARRELPVCRSLLSRGCGAGG